MRHFEHVLKDVNCFVRCSLEFNKIKILENVKWIKSGAFKVGLKFIYYIKKENPSKSFESFKYLLSIPLLIKMLLFVDFTWTLSRFHRVVVREKAKLLLLSFNHVDWSHDERYLFLSGDLSRAFSTQQTMTLSTDDSSHSKLNIDYIQKSSNGKSYSNLFCFATRGEDL